MHLMDQKWSSYHIRYLVTLIISGLSNFEKNRSKAFFSKFPPHSKLNFALTIKIKLVDLPENLDVKRFQ